MNNKLSLILELIISHPWVLLAIALSTLVVYTSISIFWGNYFISWVEFVDFWQLHLIIKYHKSLVLTIMSLIAFIALGLITFSMVISLFLITGFVITIWFIPRMISILIRYFSTQLFSYFFVTLFLVTTVFYFFPLIMLFISILTSSFSILLNYQDLFTHRSYFNTLLKTCKTTLTRFGITFLAYQYYSVVFFQLITLEFKSFTRILASHSILYVILAKIYVFFIILHLGSLQLSNLDLVLLYILLFWSLFLLVLRFFLNFAISLVDSTQFLNLKGSPVLLLTEGLPEDGGLHQNPSNSQSSSSWNRQTSSRPFTRFGFYRRANLTVGICALGVACLSTYVAYMNVIVQERQIQIQEEQIRIQREQNGIWIDQNSSWGTQNQLAEKAADQWDVDHGVKPIEYYKAKWGDK